MEVIPSRYRIGAILGEGGMGVVYDAFDEQRGHRVALKTLKQASPEALYRLKREFRVLADISHPNLVQLYDLVVGNKGTSYSMEVVEGADFVAYARGNSGRRHGADDSFARDQTLPEGIALDPTRARASFDEDRLRATLPQLVGALRALHDAGLVHRDIKPSNALVTAEGRVVLLDFGLAATRASLDDQSLQGLVGTVAYMSPEQAAEAPEVGPASDWYALGVMLYEVLTGRVPHGGKFVEALIAKRTEVPARPSDVVKGVPSDLDELCMRLLATDPDRRPSGAEVAAALGIVERERPTGRLDATLAPRFTGRARELAQFDRALAAIRDGRAALLRVRGPSGIGKSALVNEALARIQARHAEAVIIRGRCYEQELVPFKSIDGLIDGLSRVWRRLPEPEAAAILPRAAAALQRLFPVLARVPVVAESPPIGESRDPVELRARAFTALRELLQRLADRRLVVLFLDDMQWVDADTLHLLAELMRGPEPPRLMLVVSNRSEIATEALDDAIAGMDVERIAIELGPLPTDEARELAAAMLGDSRVELTERVVREAAGSPFFLGELVRYLQTVGEGAATVKIGDVVRQRIGLLPESARRLLELVALAGEPLRLRELASAAGLDAEQVARDLRVLRVDHLVRAPGGRGDERVEPYHNRIREAILDGLEPEARRQLHRALAVSLGGDAAPARLARHWAGAGDRVRAAMYARRAAERATATFDFESACDLYRMALELGGGDGDPAKRRELEIALGSSLRDAGRGGAAAETFLAAAEGADPMQRLDLRRRAAEQLLCAGLIERGFEVLRAVLAEIDEDLPQTSTRAVASFLWNHARIRLGGLRWTPRDPSRIPPRELFRLDCYVTLGLSLGMVDTMVAAMYQAKGLVVARRLGESSRLFRILALYSIFLMAQGGRSLRRGKQLIEQCMTIARESKDPYQLAMADGLVGFAAFFSGDFEVGAARIEGTVRRFRQDTVGSYAECDSLSVIMCQCLRHSGRYVELRERFDDLVRDAQQRGDNYLKTTMSRAFNLRWLLDDDVAAAREGLATAGWSPPEKGIHLQHWYELRAIVELGLYTGELDRADVARRMAAVGGSRLMRVKTVRAELRALRMRLALGFGIGDAEREIKGLTKEDISYAAVWAALGRAAVAGPERRSRLEDAVRIAEEHGMEACALAARWRLGEATGGARGAELVAAARGDFEALGVARPERFVELLAPGFGAALVKR